MSTDTRLPRTGERMNLWRGTTTMPAGTHVIVLHVWDYRDINEGLCIAIQNAASHDAGIAAPDIDTAPVVGGDDLAPLSGCDNCDAWFDPEDDPDAHEGGDRETAAGLVAYPDLCGDCVRAQTPRALWNKKVPS